MPNNENPYMIFLSPNYLKSILFFYFWLSSYKLITKIPYFLLIISVFINLKIYKLKNDESFQW
jgi:hypothetical protein